MGLFKKKNSEAKIPENIEQLKTAEQIMLYCKANKLGEGIFKSQITQMFQTALDNMTSNEKIVLPFVGYSNEYNNPVVFILTNNRIIMSSANLKSFDIIVKTANLNTIINIDTKISGITNTVYIITKGDTFQFNAGIDIINNIIPKINNTLEQFNNKSQPEQTNNPVSVADELLKFKQLLDMEAITQEEFDIKKKELLDL